MKPNSTSPLTEREAQQKGLLDTNQAIAYVQSERIKGLEMEVARLRQIVESMTGGCSERDT